MVKPVVDLPETCPQCGQKLFGMVKRCFKCGHVVDLARKTADLRAKQAIEREERRRKTLWYRIYSFIKSNLLDPLVRGNMRRRVAAEAVSPDWGIAERAIKRIPGLLSTEEALQVLLPLSRGEGNRLANRLSELPATPTNELMANTHLGSSITALGEIRDARAGARLIEIITELPNFASQALWALGSPNHASSAAQLASLAANWPQERRLHAANALYKMQTKEALEASIRIEQRGG